MGFREEYEQKLLSNVEEHGWQFTWEHGCDQAVIKAQPALWLAE